ncbi:MAG TPA: VPLPA-CTERM sorting domain-containing protein [Gammaproteobacteria bacterium]|nr:VPLPA-CTERM sorting domain-containing protein [Gammaproteobacteria bacterium]
MSSGLQADNYKTSSFFGWAVQTGDVSAVPVPAAAWLFGSGLLGLVGAARRKRANI